MEYKYYIALAASFIGGPYCLLGSILNWNFFFNKYPANFLDKYLGRKAARIIYGLFGVLMLYIGVKILTT